MGKDKVFKDELSTWEGRSVPKGEAQLEAGRWAASGGAELCPLPSLLSFRVWESGEGKTQTGAGGAGGGFVLRFQGGQTHPQHPVLQTVPGEV